MKDTLAEIKKMKTELMEKIRSVGREALGLEFKAFFEKNPEIKGIAWTQYTPYFNDGDTCVFSVNDPCFTLTDAHAPFRGWSEIKSGWHDGDTVYSSEERTWKTDPKLTVPDTETRTFFWSVADKDIFLSVFGDHAKIVALPDGTFKISEVEHD